MDKLKAEAAKWATQEEDVLTYAMFPQVAPKFFEKRNAKLQGVYADRADRLQRHESRERQEQLRTSET